MLAKLFVGRKGKEEAISWYTSLEGQGQIRLWVLSELNVWVLCLLVFYFLLLFV